MTTKTSLCAAIAIAMIVAAIAFFLTGLVYYHDSYDSATRIGEWRRLRLTYPWHVVDYGQESAGVQLEDWRVYTGEIEPGKPGPIPMGAKLETETLQTLKYIGRFAYSGGYLYGVRDVYYPSNPKGEVSTPKWFIIKCGQKKPIYCDTEDEYRKCCKSLGIDTETIRSFSDQWEDFRKKAFHMSTLTQVLQGWRYLFKQM